MRNVETANETNNTDVDETSVHGVSDEEFAQEFTDGESSPEGSVQVQSPQPIEISLNGDHEDAVIDSHFSPDSTLESGSSDSLVDNEETLQDTGVYNVPQTVSEPFIPQFVSPISVDQINVTHIADAEDDAQRFTLTETPPKIEQDLSVVVPSDSFGDLRAEPRFDGEIQGCNEPPRTERSSQGVGWVLKKSKKNAGCKMMN